MLTGIDSCCGPMGCTRSLCRECVLVAAEAIKQIEEKG
jgi:hypothetical protein